MRVKNVLEYLEAAVKSCPDKLAFTDENASLSFRELYSRSRSIGSFLISEGIYKSPAAIFMERGAEEISAFLGCAAGGDFYVPIDGEMPEGRLQHILDLLEPPVVICSEKTAEKAGKLNLRGGKAVLYKDIINYPENPSALDEIAGKAVDSDLLYVVFTSGSTGIPKGVTASHRSVIDYIEGLSEVLGFSGETVFGNQSPFYLDACLKEIYPTLKFAASAYIIPKKLFSAPLRLIEYLNLHKINTICWVPSALTMLSAYGSFDIAVPACIKTVAFGGERFPARQLRLWQEALPEARFINLYGPTEGTGMCCYYNVDRIFADNEPIPIGRALPNREILLLNGSEEAGPGEEGEICIRGSAISPGYYKAPELTAASFVQNPLNSSPEIIYKTGDIGRYNEAGELIFVTRRDGQIKHMGRRIELTEPELCAAAAGADLCGCIYDEVKRKIVLFYEGSIKSGELMAKIRKELPKYMLPGKIIMLEKMPLSPGGKIDRIKLRELYEKM